MIRPIAPYINPPAIPQSPPNALSLTITSQLTCRVEERGGPKKPELWDIKWSSSLEDIADKESIDVEKGVAVVVSPGTRKFKVNACQRSDNIFCIHHHKCASSVLRLEAMPEGRYRVRAKVSKRNDYAETWIENLSTGEIVSKPVLIQGLSCDVP
jgi:hypothetical protein